MHLLRRQQRLLGNPVQYDGDAAVQVESLEKGELFAGQMQRRHLRGAHQEYLQGIAKNFQRITLQVAGHIDANCVVVAQTELGQIVNLRWIHAHIRVQRSGVQHIKFGHRGDQLLP